MSSPTGIVSWHLPFPRGRVSTGTAQWCWKKESGKEIGIRSPRCILHPWPLGDGRQLAPAQRRVLPPVSPELTWVTQAFEYQGGSSAHWSPSSGPFLGVLSTACLHRPHFLSRGPASSALVGHSQDLALFWKQGRAPRPLGCPTYHSVITGSAFPPCAYPVPDILSGGGSSAARLALKPPRCLSGGLSLLASLVSGLP